MGAFRCWVTNNEWEEQWWSLFLLLLPLLYWNEDW